MPITIDYGSLDSLIAYYDQFNSEERNGKHTSIGWYSVTPMDDLVVLFDWLNQAGCFDGPPGIIVDAGGGDGRIAALATLYRQRAYSIEGDLVIHGRAQQRLGFLYKWRILERKNGTPTADAILGDFTREEVYTRNGIDPTQVDIVFNTGQNEDGFVQLFHKVAASYYLVLMHPDASRVEPPLTRNVKCRLFSRDFSDYHMLKK